LQLENGVGLVSLLRSEVADALNDCEAELSTKRKITIATGEAAYPFIREMVDTAQKKWDNLECSVKAIKNNFFGRSITVAGLITAKDIVEQLKDEDLGEELLIPAVMLREGSDTFLDSVTVAELSQTLGVKITAVQNDGYDFIDKILGLEGEGNG
jgi:NifB/MoaA-like Fe-S oxidoreductase